MLEAFLIILLLWVAFEIACQGVVGFVAACGSLVFRVAFFLLKAALVIWLFYSVYMLFAS